MGSFVVSWCASVCVFTAFIRTEQFPFRRTHQFPSEFFSKAPETRIHRRAVEDEEEAPADQKTKCEKEWIGLRVCCVCFIITFPTSSFDRNCTPSLCFPRLVPFLFVTIIRDEILKSVLQIPSKATKNWSRGKQNSNNQLKLYATYSHFPSSNKLQASCTQFFQWTWTFIFRALGSAACSFFRFAFALAALLYFKVNAKCARYMVFLSPSKMLANDGDFSRTAVLKRGLWNKVCGTMIADVEHLKIARNGGK